MIAARWYGLDEEGGKIICVEIKDDRCFLTVREHPSDVWSPPKELKLDTMAFAHAT